MGSDEAQRSILEEIERGREVSADEIKATLLDDRPTVALAIFPLEQYTGTITTDLFAEDETSYFDDAEQFFALQKEAVDATGEASRGQRRMGGGDGRLPHSRLAVPQGAEEPERRRPHQSRRPRAGSRSAKVWSSARSRRKPPRRLRRTR